MRSDYCNALGALYMGLPMEMSQKIKLIQNAAAHMLMRANWYDNVSLVLWELHWLPIIFSTQFKMPALTYNALNHLGPGYLKDWLCQYLPTYVHLGVPSAKEIQLVGTRKRAFLVVAPILLRSVLLHLFPLFKNLLRWSFSNKSFNENLPPGGWIIGGCFIYVLVWKLRVFYSFYILFWILIGMETTLRLPMATIRQGF